MILATYVIEAIVQDEYSRPVFKCINAATDDVVFVPCYVHSNKAKLWIGRMIEIRVAE